MAGAAGTLGHLDISPETVVPPGRAERRRPEGFASTAPTLTGNVAAVHFDTGDGDDPFGRLSAVSDECHDGWIVAVDLDHDGAQAAPIFAGVGVLHDPPVVSEMIARR